MYPLEGSGIALLLLCHRSSADYFSKTLPFYFRWRCAGADLKEMGSIAPLQRKATFNPVHPVGRKGFPGKLVFPEGASALADYGVSAETPAPCGSGNQRLRAACYPAPEIDGRTACLRPREIGFLGEKRYERERAPQRSKSNPRFFPKRFFASFLCVQKGCRRQAKPDAPPGLPVT